MEQDAPIVGFYAPVHRALTEPILLGGAPRVVPSSRFVCSLSRALIG